MEEKKKKQTIGNGGIVNILTVAASPHINNPSDLVEILCLIIVYEKSNTLAPMTHCKVLPVQLLFHTFFQSWGPNKALGLKCLLRARSQIPVSGLTGRARGGWLSASGAGFSRQNLRIKYIPCVGINL